MMAIRYTINVMNLNHPETNPNPAPHLWKNFLPQNWSLVPKRLETTALDHKFSAVSVRQEGTNI